MSLAASIAARMLGRGKPTAPKRARTRTEPDAPPAAKAARRREEPALVLPPPAPPAPAPPPPVITPGWKASCKAVCALTGRRCRLPEHRVDEPHRHERGPFTLTASPTQTQFAGRAEIERAAASRPTNPFNET